MRPTHDTRSFPRVRDSVGIAGCDPVALVRVSEQFAELELEVLRRSEVTAAQIAAERQDWAQAGVCMGRVYQALCDGNPNEAMAALDAISELLGKRGILVPKPAIRPSDLPEGADEQLSEAAAIPTTEPLPNADDTLPFQHTEVEAPDGQHI